MLQNNDGKESASEEKRRKVTPENLLFGIVRDMPMSEEWSIWSSAVKQCWKIHIGAWQNNDGKESASEEKRRKVTPENLLFGIVRDMPMSEEWSIWSSAVKQCWKIHIGAWCISEPKYPRYSMKLL